MKEQKEKPEKTKPENKKETPKPTTKAKEETKKETKPPAKRTTQKTKTALKKTKQIQNKKKPTFRGRFGKKHCRKVKSKKWDKWRVPRGIDVQKKQESGPFPKTGYRTKKEIRYHHPSGYKETLIRNIKELEQIKETAIRISRTVGNKKRKEIAQKAKEKNIIILNR
jgi:large subunit ribosomal protein L32e